MQIQKIISSIILSACGLIGCSGNNATNESKDSSSVSEATGSGSDMFYEYKLTSGGAGININSDTKMYVSSKGEMRVEMDIVNSAAKDNDSGPIVIIAHADKPNESISIDDAAKTYSVNHFNDSDFNTGEKIKSSATKIGEEKILGFNSVHARVISNKNIGGAYSEVDTLELWRSNDVPLPPSVKVLMDKFNSKDGMALYSPDVSSQLEQMGCAGFMTKLEIHSRSASVTEVLIKAEHRDLPASMFQVPAGYKEDKNAAL